MSQRGGRGPGVCCVLDFMSRLALRFRWGSGFCIFLGRRVWTNGGRGGAGGIYGVCCVLVSMRG